MPHVELYIVRHAIAADRGEEWPDDSKRPLTTRGVDRFKECVRGLVWLEVGLDEIFTSPLVRARQTANLLAAGFKEKPPVKVLESLSPGHTPMSVMQELNKIGKRRRVALVGHEPGLGELAAHLVGSSRAIPFRKGGVCRIDVESFTSRRPGELQWMIPPRILRELK